MNTRFLCSDHAHPFGESATHPMAMLKPRDDQTHRAYLWAYALGAFEDMKAVVYDFCVSRAVEHASAFLGDWRGSLICDDYSGHKMTLMHAVTEVGCLSHARRKLFICTRAATARWPSLRWRSLRHASSICSGDTLLAFSSAPATLNFQGQPHSS